ncbi:MAG: hypothetical protein C0458_15570 [Methylobacterium sp.]|nr:hypothetical protein [Methylobacterium sp.]
MKATILNAANRARIEERSPYLVAASIGWCGRRRDGSARDASPDGFGAAAHILALMQRAINRRVAQRTRLLRRFGDEILSPSRAEAGARRFDEVFAVDIGVFEIKFTLNFLMNLTYSLGSLLVLGIGCVLAVRGQTEIATVVTFLSATTKIVDPWNDIVDWARGLAMTTVKYDLIVGGLGMGPTR